MKVRLGWLGAVLSFLIFSATPVLAAPAVDKVAEQLICQCGCLMVLNNCSHQECASREIMLGMIQQRISQGQSVEQIVQSFARQYGEEVLAEPPKKGFNLTAWLFPIVALIVGAGAIILALRRWVSKRLPAAVNESGGNEQDPSYEQRIEQELKKFPDWGFR
jgi:cytochrome c-type biogenesis protein CcmH